MNKLLLSVLLVSMQQLLCAQLLYNDGADFAVTGGGIVFVDGAAENAAGGFFTNAGEVTVRGYFKNEELADGGNARGQYIIYGDWINNNSFVAHQSRVRLVGNDQYITGSQVTTFYDLSLETQGAVKTQTLDANVNDVLSLNSCELYTGDYKMTIFNPYVSGITRASGFVSSTGPGRLVRYTTVVDTFLFPTGWNRNGTIIYRPIEMTPSVTQLQHFAVRMVPDDPTFDGYDVNVKAADVTGVNTTFYHLIKQFNSNAPADLSIYYDPVRDGQWKSIGRWQNVPQWQDLQDVIVEQPQSRFPPFRNVKKGWVDNGSEPHALINVEKRQVLFDYPNVFTPNGSGPGENNTFHIINQLGLVEQKELKIFNRWGEPVFDSARDGVPDWDGFYQGKLQIMGNYVFMAKVSVIATGEIKDAGGNISLLW
jgi:gliding motility-associated-like protein